MSLPRFARQHACGTKRRYRTPGAARWALHALLRDQPGAGHMQVYQCSFCRRWHIGTVREKAG
jgi:hypothetical protein